MTAERQPPLMPRVEAALAELKERIGERFPGAIFAVEEGSDPEGIYLVATVDVDDTDEVLELVGDRLVELQVAEGLPLFLAPLRPLERVVADLRRRERPTPLAPLPL